MSAAPSKTRVLLVAGRASLAAGLRALLGAGDLEVVGEASTLAGAEAGLEGAATGEPAAKRVAPLRPVSTNHVELLSSRRP